MDLRPWIETWLRPCCSCGRIPYRNPWRCLTQTVHGFRLQGAWYCGSECLQRALAAVLEQEKPARERAPAAAHRVPLGLLLLSRQQVTNEQLRAALDSQRSAGKGKIGEWLQQLGFVDETQITGALARQWSCPVLRSSPAAWGASNFMAIPLALLEASQMVPAEFAAASQTLLMAFCEAVDHSTLYAVERMLGCRTQACFVGPSVLRQRLQWMTQIRRPQEFVFDRVEDISECSRIIASYSGKVSADEIRLIRCGRHLWIRLDREKQEPVHLVMRSADFRVAGPAARELPDDSLAVQSRPKVPARLADNF
jgi:hypothetical protein